MSMYPPKQKKSYLSDTKRERLLNIQKREQLKGMLINKFKDKYRGQKSENFINKEVNNFLSNEKLTEDNLRKLEERIKLEHSRAEVDDQVDRRSQASKAPSVSGRSIASSKMSGASNLSRKLANKPRDDDAASVVSARSNISRSSRATSGVSAINEDDEWAAILKFNTHLHQEEVRQQHMREKEQKRRIKDELDQQIHAKKKQVEEERKMENLYESAQRNHLDLLAEKDREREMELKKKTMREKELRDRQLRDENDRKRRDMNEQKRLEEMAVKRLRDELDQEKRLAEEKRKEEKRGFQRVLKENEERRVRMQQLKEKERLEDVRAQEAYARVLAKQEQDRANEVAARERRAQDLMGRMAENVIKKQDEKAMEHERNMLKAQQDKEYRDRLEDEARRLRLRKNQEETKQFLEMQINEKKAQKEQERKLREEQAEIWRRDLEDFQSMEKSKKQKEDSVNRAHQDILLRQIEEKKTAKRARKMDRVEVQLNKQILKEIKKQGHDSQVGDDHLSYQHGV